MDVEDQKAKGVVVVGVDGSASANRALHWAAIEAARRDAVLRIVSAWSVPVTAWSVVTAYVVPEDFRENAQQIVDRARSAVRQKMGDESPAMETRIVQDGAASGLIAAGRETDLLVVGTRGRGGFLSLVLGSVAVSCAHHTPVPLVVIGRASPEPGSGDIVVGLDESVGARRALRWAVAEADRLGVGVRAVHGWDIPPAGPAGAPTFAPADPDPDIVRRTEEALDEIIREETADVANRPPVSAEVVATTAPEALVVEAEEAALLVVGSRGRGGFTGLLLGSVSRQVLAHSPCPLVIIPKEASERPK